MRSNPRKSSWKTYTCGCSESAGAEGRREAGGRKKEEANYFPSPRSSWEFSRTRALEDATFSLQRTTG